MQKTAEKQAGSGRDSKHGRLHPAPVKTLPCESRFPSQEESRYRRSACHSPFPPATSSSARQRVYIVGSNSTQKPKKTVVRVPETDESESFKETSSQNRIQKIFFQIQKNTLPCRHTGQDQKHLDQTESEYRHAPSFPGFFYIFQKYSRD